MRHFLAARPVATRPHSMGKSPPTAALIAPSSRPLCVVAGTISAIIGAVDLTAIVAAADQRLAATPSLACSVAHAHKQPRRRGVTAVGSANIPWTNATLAAILASHACPAPCGARRRVQPPSLTSAPCLLSIEANLYPPSDEPSAGAHRNGIIPQHTTAIRQALPMAPPEPMSPNLGGFRQPSTAGCG